MTWTLAKSLVQLRDQINKEWPKRSKRSDGTLGDAAHAARKSDHNPNSKGVVTAMDVTDDDASGADMAKVAEALRASRDKRIKYVIHMGRYFSVKTGWQWSKYSGVNAHEKHLHISVVADQKLWDDMSVWPIKEGDDDVPQFTEEEAAFLKQLKKNVEGEGSNVDAFKVMIKLIRWLRVKFQGEDVP